MSSFLLGYLSSALLPPPRILARRLQRLATGRGRRTIDVDGWALPSTTVDSMKLSWGHAGGSVRCFLSVFGRWRWFLYVCMYVKLRRHQHTRVHAPGLYSCKLWEYSEISNQLYVHLWSSVTSASKASSHIHTIHVYLLITDSDSHWRRVVNDQLDILYSLVVLAVYTYAYALSEIIVIAPLYITYY